MFALRKTLLAAAMSLFALSSWAAGSPVWEVRGEGGFLIGGTMHMLRPGDFPLPEVFDRAYDITDTLVLETDLGALADPEIQRLLAERGFQRHGRSLADDLRPDTWQRLTAFAAELGVGITVLEGMRPSFAGLTLVRAMLGRLGVTAVGTDGHFYRRAQADGRALASLESPREQMLMLLSLGEEDPDRFLDANLEDLQRAGSMIDDAVDAWRRGDFDLLHEQLVEPSRLDDPISYRRIFVERNAAWLRSLERFADSAEREFVLVGAGHLGGSDGLLRALDEAGYEVQAWYRDDRLGDGLE